MSFYSQFYQRVPLHTESVSVVGRKEGGKVEGGKGRKEKRRESKRKKAKKREREEGK